MDTPQETSAIGLVCNIDRKGRAMRAAFGVVCLVLAAAGGVIVWLAGLGFWGWAAVAGVALGGLFGLFEAANGWCVVRALGYRTRV